MTRRPNLEPPQRWRARGKVSIALLAGLASLFLYGCPNLSPDIDLKAQIQNDVKVANADKVTVKVQPESEAMGVTDPQGTSNTFKIDIPFNVSMTVSPDYAFLRWEQVGGNGEIAFADATKPETTVTVTKTGTDLVIVAKCDARPTVIIKDPDGGEGILRNRKIVVTFSESVDPASVGFDTISVEAKSRNSTALPVSIVDRLLPPVVSGASVEISLQPGQQFDAQNYIWIKVSKNVRDLGNGSQMKEDFAWYFITGNSADILNPYINSFRINSGQAQLIADGHTKLRGLILIVDAADDGGVTTIRVTETAMADMNGAPVTGVVSTADYDYAASLPYLLATSGDGRKKIAVQVLDTMGHLSDNAPDSTLILDTNGPLAASFGADCGPATNAGTVTIEQAVLDKSLVICPVPRGRRSQRLEQVGGKLAPLGPGDDGRLAPAALSFRHARKFLVPPEQAGANAIPFTRDTMPVPTRAELLDVGSRLEIEPDLVALDEYPGRRGV